MSSGTKLSSSPLMREDLSYFDWKKEKEAGADRLAEKQDR